MSTQLSLDLGAAPLPYCKVTRAYRVLCVREPSLPAPTRTCIQHHDDAAAYARTLLSDQPSESCVVIAFDPGHRVIGHIVFRGTAGECPVLPQHIFQFLILSCASNFILAHNHPGGTREPSIADWSLTKKLYATGDTLSIRLVDHIIISDTATISMRSMSQWPTI